MDTFNFDKNDIILIYGYGKLGKDLFRKLIKKGYRVKGFIDKNVQIIDENSECILFKPEDLNEELMNHIIILTFRNILEQERIAKELYKKGANKIVYLNKSNGETYKTYFEIYNSLIYGQQIKDFQFPCAKFKTGELKSLYYYEKEDLITVEVPITMIFSKGLQLKERNIVTLSEYNAVYELITAGDTKQFKDYENYCSMMKIYGNEKTLESFLEDRVSLFSMMIKEYREKGIEFFRNSPSIATWNNRGYFNLLDGHHRAVFLIHNMNYDIPIKISKQDYDKWFNKESVIKCKEFIEKNNIKKTYTPIRHPEFLNIASIVEEIDSRTTSAIYKYFGREDISTYRVLDLNSNLSYYAQIFYRMGVKRVVSVENRKHFFDFANLINNLYYIKNMEMRNIDMFEMDEKEKFDVVILANDIRLDFDKRIMGTICLKKIDALTSNKLIWRSNMSPEAEKKYILGNSSFKRYKCLNKEFIGGRLIEVGVYEK